MEQGDGGECGYVDYGDEANLAVGCGVDADAPDDPGETVTAGALDVWAGTAASTTNGHGNRDNQVAVALNGLTEDAADAELMTGAV